MTRRAIAVYDLDRTITRRPTYSHFLLHAARRNAPLRLALVPLVPICMLAYIAGLIDRDRLKSAMWGLLLGKADPQRLSEAIGSFTRWTLSANIRPGARRQIAHDRDRGALLVLATAALDLYARPIAEGLGFDAVVATRMAVGGDGRIGPALAEANVYAAAKLAALERLLVDREIARADTQISFYSDSSTDRPVFIWADEPVAVAPSRKLARMAAEAGWTVMDWG
jgi:HAD superfamily phosphoserine phosphatase-like hydrolase